MKYKNLVIFIIALVLVKNMVGAQDKILPIYSVDTDEKLISLTFDVAWGDEDMVEVLQILDDNDVKATFFLVGDWVEDYPEQVKTIHEKGHDIANHSDRHPHVTKLTKDEVKADIMEAHKKVKDLLGVEMDLYRAPYGEYDNEVVEAAHECNYHIIQWDVDSLDWKNYGKQPLIDKVLKHKNLTYGSIVLLHTGTDHTKDALDEIIKGLKQKEYKIVPTSELIMRENYRCDHTGRQYKK